MKVFRNISMKKTAGFTRGGISPLLMAIFILIILLGFRTKGICDYKYQPSIGLWFGPTAPLASTNKAVDGHLGGGILTRGNLPFWDLYYSFDFSWLHFTSNVEKTLDLFPFAASLMYLLPWSLPVKVFLKVGSGSTFVKIQPENKGGWDPTFTAGTEFFFPAGKIVRIGLRVDYYWIIERYLPRAQRDGYALNIGLTVYFNLVK
jgi:hypothetical protein